jgi:hypothetical protein
MRSVPVDVLAVVESFQQRRALFTAMVDVKRSGLIQMNCVARPVHLQNLSWLMAKSQHGAILVIRPSACASQLQMRHCLSHHNAIRCLLIMIPDSANLRPQVATNHQAPTTSEHIVHALGCFA